jgi:hypothetical protein
MKVGLPILKYYAKYAWRDWGKPQSSSVRIANLLAEIRNRDVPPTNQENLPLDCTGRLKYKYM